MKIGISFFVILLATNTCCMEQDTTGRDTYDKFRTLYSFTNGLELRTFQKQATEAFKAIYPQQADSSEKQQYFTCLIDLLYQKKMVGQPTILYRDTHTISFGRHGIFTMQNTTPQKDRKILESVLIEQGLLFAPHFNPTTLGQMIPTAPLPTAVIPTAKELKPPLPTTVIPIPQEITTPHQYRFLKSSITVALITAGVIGSAVALYKLIRYWKSQKKKAPTPPQTTIQEPLLDTPTIEKPTQSGPILCQQNTDITPNQEIAPKKQTPTITTRELPLIEPIELIPSTEVLDDNHIQHTEQQDAGQEIPINDLAEPTNLTALVSEPEIEAANTEQIVETEEQTVTTLETEITNVNAIEQTITVPQNDESKENKEHQAPLIAPEIRQPLEQLEAPQHSSHRNKSNKKDHHKRGVFPILYGIIQLPLLIFG
jgi:hypothetical protein